MFVTVAFGHKYNILSNMCAKFHENRSFTFKVMTKKSVLDESFRILLRQSWKKNVGTFYPDSMLIRGMSSEASARSPTLTDGDGEGL